MTSGFDGFGLKSHRNMCMDVPKTYQQNLVLYSNILRIYKGNSRKENRRNHLPIPKSFAFRLMWPFQHNFELAKTSHANDVITSCKNREDA